jgi:hypothetical protein
MSFGLTANLGVGEENKRGWVKESPAFQSGLPIRGIGRLVRNAGSPLHEGSMMAAGVPVEVTWSVDVSWTKRIRVSEP